MTNLILIQADITKLKVDAIVNAANTGLLGGGGVDGAIHRAAGSALLKECKSIGGCATGDAKITSAYQLDARYIIHAVGPVFNNHSPKQAMFLLQSAYETSLKLALQNNVKSIAFPNISTGVYSYPKQDAAIIAINTVKQFLLKKPTIDKILFCCFDKDNYSIYKSLLEKDAQNV